MADVYRVFVRALQNLWGPGYWVAWPPSQRLSLGDVGVIEKGLFVRTEGLAELGVDVSAEAGSARASLTYDSGGTASVTFKASGDSPTGFQGLAQADAGALVQFGTANGVLCVYDDLRETRVQRLEPLTATLIEWFWAGRWREDHAVVTHLVSARSATILVGAASGAQAELRASATAGGGPATLGQLGANMSVARRQHIGFELVGSGLTPFFRLLRLRRTFMGRITTQHGRGAGPAQRPVPVEVMEEALESPASVFEEFDQLTAIDVGDRR